jgi:hypothetical protein
VEVISAKEVAGLTRFSLVPFLVVAEVLGILVITSAIVGNHRRNTSVERESVYFKNHMYDETIACFLPP